MAFYLLATSSADASIPGASTANTASSSRPSYVSEGVYIQNDSGCVFDLSEGTSEVWLRCYLNSSALFSGRSPVRFRNAANTPIFWLNIRNTTLTLPMKFVMHNASGTEVPIDGTDMAAPSGYHMWDFHVKLDETNGFVKVWIDEVQVLDYSGRTTYAWAGKVIDKIGFYSMQASVTSQPVSHIIAANEDTRGMLMAQVRPNANGDSTDWTGTYTDINEAGYNDSTVLQSVLSGDISTFMFDNIPSALEGYAVKAVAIAARGQKGVSAPTDLDFVARVEGTNYFTNPTKGNPPSFGGVQGIMYVNPATGLPWTTDDVNAAQFGVRSKA